MKTIKKTTFALVLICLSLIFGCSSDDDSNNPEALDGPHTYDITINAGSTNERNLSGDIANTLEPEGGNELNFSAYTNIENAKLIVLSIRNNDIMISAMFYHGDDGQTADLGMDTDIKSNMIFNFLPPAADLYQSVSGSVALTNIDYGISVAEGGIAGYTVTFDGAFEDIDDNISQIKGTVVVKLPK